MDKNIKLLKGLNRELEKMQNSGTGLGQGIGGAWISHIPFLDSVRTYSSNLYDALNNISRCDCHPEAPSAMLRLEKRKTPESHESNSLRFSLLLSLEKRPPENDRTPWNVHETEIRIHEE
jgi:hypothetical protein